METIPEQPEFIGSDYGLDEERWEALPVEAKVCFGIASMGSEQEEFENAEEVREKVEELSGLSTDEVRHANTLLISKGYLDRTGFMTGGALKLYLNEKGFRFLEEEIEKVKKT